MRDFEKHLILTGTTIRSALSTLDKLAKHAITFIVDKDNKLKGSLTDGDIRRALIKGASIDQAVDDIIQSHPKFIREHQDNTTQILAYRENGFRILPIINEEEKVVGIVNFSELKSYLPLDVIIMAGGQGARLRPLTLDTPKPLLKVGEKPIIEHNIDRLRQYGMKNFWISVNYLGEQIESYFGDGAEKNIHIQYLWEKKPLGTIGAVAQISNFLHDYILLTNSDLLTNLDYEDFFLQCASNKADMSIATIPYTVQIPYAVLETNQGMVTDFKEKPSYTYYSNAGIYLIKKEHLQLIPKDQHFNATDLMEQLIKMGKTVSSYPLIGYWLDIGKHEDYKKAQEDIKHIKF